MTVSAIETTVDPVAPPPEHLSEQGQRIWAAGVDGWELDESARAILELCLVSFVDDAPLEQDETPITWSTSLSSCGDSLAGGSSSSTTFPTDDPADVPTATQHGG